MRVLWGNDKPYFQIEDRSLVLRNVPLPPPLAAQDHLNPVKAVLSYSFLIDVALRRLESEWWLRGRPMHAMRAHSEDLAVSCLLMRRLRQLKDKHDVEVVVVGKYSPHAWQRRSPHHFEAGIADKVLNCAKESGLEAVDTRDEMEAAVLADDDIRGLMSPP